MSDTLLELAERVKKRVGAGVVREIDVIFQEPTPAGLTS